MCSKANCHLSDSPRSQPLRSRRSKIQQSTLSSQQLNGLVDLKRTVLRLHHHLLARAAKQKHRPSHAPMKPRKSRTRRRPRHNLHESTTILRVGFRVPKLRSETKLQAQQTRPPIQSNSRARIGRSISRNPPSFFRKQCDRHLLLSQTPPAARRRGRPLVRPLSVKAGRRAFMLRTTARRHRREIAMQSSLLAISRVTT